MEQIYKDSDGKEYYFQEGFVNFQMNVTPKRYQKVQQTFIKIPIDKEQEELIKEISKSKKFDIKNAVLQVLQHRINEQIFQESKKVYIRAFEKYVQKNKQIKRRVNKKLINQTMLNQNIKSLNDYENLDFIDKYMYLNKKAQNENNMLIFAINNIKIKGHYASSLKSKLNEEISFAIKEYKESQQQNTIDFIDEDYYQKDINEVYRKSNGLFVYLNSGLAYDLESHYDEQKFHFYDFDKDIAIDTIQAINKQKQICIDKVSEQNEQLNENNITLEMLNKMLENGEVSLKRKINYPKPKEIKCKVVSKYNKTKTKFIIEVNKKQEVIQLTDSILRELYLDTKVENEEQLTEQRDDNEMKIQSYKKFLKRFDRLVVKNHFKPKLNEIENLHKVLMDRNLIKRENNGFNMI